MCKHSTTKSEERNNKEIKWLVLGKKSFCSGCSFPSLNCYTLEIHSWSFHSAQHLFVFFPKGCAAWMLRCKCKVSQVWVAINGGGVKGLLLDCFSHAASSWRHQCMDKMTRTRVCTESKKNVLSNETIGVQIHSFWVGEPTKGSTVATSLRKWRKAERSFHVTKAVSRI